MAMPAVRFASLLPPAAVASARFMAAMYSTAAAWSCRASYQRQPCQPAAAPTIATAQTTISPPYRFSSCCARSARSSSSTSSKMSTTWSPAIRCLMAGPAARRTIAARPQARKRDANVRFTRKLHTVGVRTIAILLLLAGCGATPEQVVPGVALFGIGSIAVIQRSPFDAVYSVLSGRDCSIVRLGPGQELLPPGRAAARTATLLHARFGRGGLLARPGTLPQSAAAARRRSTDIDPAPGSRPHPEVAAVLMRYHRTIAATSASVFRSIATSAAFIASAIAGGSLPASLTSAVSVLCNRTLVEPRR